MVCKVRRDCVKFLLFIRCVCVTPPTPYDFCRRAEVRPQVDLQPTKHFETSGADSLRIYGDFIHKT